MPEANSHNGSPKRRRGQALATAAYWNDHFSQSNGADEPTHEWLRNFAELEPFFNSKMFGVSGFEPEKRPLIVHLGSGDSTIPMDFAARGYTRQLCIDFSSTVVNKMTGRHAGHGIEWRLLDLRNMKVVVADTSIDVAFDKSILDAMIYGKVLDNTLAYLSEVHRTLKDTGGLFCVSFRQPHFMKPLFSREGLT
ncbi:hypothetical protein B0H66DRAFT_585195 [Apodospora peruviana]|uniref:Methyltransferase type 11 domain-containing protein n=1 Tax=Apodospora peruviana TaxID=516989 RepID=A0AAE0LY38_9PEZI|nr:hypothetical protein B0H66DRAFT_585195 [Apodospora peruviana]